MHIQNTQKWSSCTCLSQKQLVAVKCSCDTIAQELYGELAVQIGKQSYRRLLDLAMQCL